LSKSSSAKRRSRSVFLRSKRQSECKRSSTGLSCFSSRTKKGRSGRLKSNLRRCRKKQLRRRKREKRNRLDRRKSIARERLHRLRKRLRGRTICSGTEKRIK